LVNIAKLGQWTLMFFLLEGMIYFLIFFDEILWACSKQDLSTTWSQSCWRVKH